MEKKLIKWIKELEGYLPVQGSKQWKLEKTRTIGGTDIGKVRKSKKDIVCRKTGMRPRIDALPMLMGTCLEEITQLCTSIVARSRIYDAPGNIPSCEVKGKTYSPDGFGITKMIQDGDVAKFLTVLYEFKTMWTRIPKQGIVPNNYIPQIKSGLSDLPITDIGVFSECFFRLCPWEAMLDSESLEYNETLHVKDMPYEDVLMDGFMVFYRKDNNNMSFDQERTFNSFITEASRTGGPDGPFDWGIEGNKNNLFSLFMLKKCEKIEMFSSTVNTYPKNFERVEWVEEQKRTVPHFAVDHKKSLKRIMGHIEEKDYIFMGVMPWKLFEINMVTVEKEVGYTKQFEEDIIEVLAEINELNDIEDVEERYKEYNKRYNKQIEFADLTEKELEEDPAYLLSIFA